MDEKQSLIVAAVRDGKTIVQAAEEAVVPEATVRRWLRNGRKNPNGSWGAFARSVDACRLAVPEQTAGERVAEIEALAERVGDEDPGALATIGLARALAHKIDWCESTPSGAAAMALANLSKQYREVLAEMQPDASDEDQEWLASLFRPLDDPEHVENQRLRAALQVIASGRSDGTADYMKPRCSAEEAKAIAWSALYGQESLLDDETPPQEVAA